MNYIFELEFDEDSNLLQGNKNNKLRIQSSKRKENFIKSAEYADFKGTLHSRQNK